MTRNGIGEAIRQARRRRQMTQVELAQAAGVGQGQLSLIETGRREPT